MTKREITLLEKIYGKDNHQACAYGYMCSKCKRDILVAKIKNKK